MPLLLLTIIIRDAGLRFGSAAGEADLKSPNRGSKPKWP